MTTLNYQHKHNVKQEDLITTVKKTRIRHRSNRKFLVLKSYINKDHLAKQIHDAFQNLHKIPVFLTEDKMYIKPRNDQTQNPLIIVSLLAPSHYIK